MRVLFATTAGSGHFGPLVPLARACVEAWYEVRVAAPGSFAAEVARAGLEHATVNAGVSATMRYAAALLDGPLGELHALAGRPAGTCAAAMTAAPVLSSVLALLDGPQPPSRSAHLYRDDAYRLGAGTLPEPWGDPEHPLVYVTLGSVAGSLGVFHGLYPAILEALADRPVRVLLTTGHGVDVDALVVPPNAHVEQWWPQSDVMPSAAAVVGHGGFGTTMAAVAAAVPQVVVPVFAFDQRVNAEHVAACGFGPALLDGPASISSLGGAVERVLTEPSFRDAARAVADQLATHPSPADVVPVLERMAAG